MLEAARLAAEDELPEPSPLFWPHLAARIGEAVRREPAPVASWRPWAWRLAPIGAAAAVVIVIGVGARFWTATPITPAAVPGAPAASSTQGPGASATETGRADDPSWLLVSELSAHVSVDDAEASGALPLPGGVERALAHLDDSRTTGARADPARGDCGAGAARDAGAGSLTAVEESQRAQGDSRPCGHLSIGRAPSSSESWRRPGCRRRPTRSRRILRRLRRGTPGCGRSARQGQGRAAAQQADRLDIAELQRLFDAYMVMQAQDALQLDDAQFGQFLPKLKALQDTRRRNEQARNRLVAELGRLTAPSAAGRRGSRARPPARAAGTGGPVRRRSAPRLRHGRPESSTSGGRRGSACSSRTWSAGSSS